MIEPKKKHSIARKRTRHSAWKTITLKKITNKVALATCNHCGASRLNHRVCLACGFYGDKQVLTIKTKKSSVIDA